MNNRQRTGFTLIEVVISIAILSAVSGVLLNLFITASSINDTAETRSMASLMCRNAIERVQHQAISADQTVTTFYDEQWQPHESESNSSYRVEMRITRAEQPHMMVAEATAMARDGNAIVSYTVQYAVQGGEQ